MRAVPFVLLSAALSGCFAGFVRDEQLRIAATTTLKEPTIEVLDAAGLAGVKRVAVLPFRNLAWDPGNGLDVWKDDAYLKGRVFGGHKGLPDLFAERVEE